MGLVGSRKEAKGKCSSVMSGDSLALAAPVNHLALGVLIVCEKSTSAEYTSRVMYYFDVSVNYKEGLVIQTS